MDGIISEHRDDLIDAPGIDLSLEQEMRGFDDLDAGDRPGLPFPSLGPHQRQLPFSPERIIIEPEYALAFFEKRVPLPRGQLPGDALILLPDPLFELRIVPQGKVWVEFNMNAHHTTWMSK